MASLVIAVPGEPTAKGRDPRPISEDAIQTAIIELLSYTAHPSLIWYHCPNGAMVKDTARIYFSRLGVRPGIADLCFVLPDRSAAFMEVKTAKGRQSLEQREFQAQCEALGVPYAVVRSSLEAELVLKKWGALRASRCTASMASIASAGDIS